MPKFLNPNAPRVTKIFLRVNEHELQEIKGWLDGFTARRAHQVGREIGDRLVQPAGFGNIPALLRCILGLPEISAGAPMGNQNHAGKAKVKE